MMKEGIAQKEQVDLKTLVSDCRDYGILFDISKRTDLDPVISSIIYHRAINYTSIMCMLAKNSSTNESVRNIIAYKNNELYNLFLALNPKLAQVTRDKLKKSLNPAVRAVALYNDTSESNVPLHLKSKFVINNLRENDEKCFDCYYALMESHYKQIIVSSDISEELKFLALTKHNLSVKELEILALDKNELIAKFANEVLRFMH